MSQCLQLEMNPYSQHAWLALPQWSHTLGQVPVGSDVARDKSWTSGAGMGSNTLSLGDSAVYCKHYRGAGRWDSGEALLTVSL